MEILGIALFASVVLYLAVTHRGFRKVLIWVGAACLLCAMAGGFYLWHRNRAEANAKRAAQAADDAVQNARITHANALRAKWSRPWSIKNITASEFPPSFVVIVRDGHVVSDRPYKLRKGDIVHVLDGNATLNEDGGTSLFSCNQYDTNDDILGRVANGDRVKVLRFGYEWGSDGNYGAKIQLTNGPTGCILNGSYLKLDGEGWKDFPG